MVIEAIKVVLIGMAVVFFALSVLAIIFYVVGKIVKRISKASKADNSGGTRLDALQSGAETQNSESNKTLDVNGADPNTPSDFSKVAVALSDDAALVAAVATSCYVYNSGHVKNKERVISPWLLEGRRALLANKPLREVWRRTH